MAVTEKRQLDETVYSTKHIVLDIEGTTTSISFVKDTLFPYVRKNLDEYLSSHWNEDEFKDVLALLKSQAAEDKKAEMEGAIEIPSDGSDDDMKAAVAKSVLWQMDADRKTTALKKLQGQMWRHGYKSGELKGHLFADVAPSLKDWVKDGRKLYVYSSGSVEAQKLLFGNSADGDLTELFTDFFDTEVGAKVDVESYKSIVKKLDCNADDVLFLTDMPKEASAAREAGLPVILVEREGNEPIASELRKEFSAVSSFQEVAFESASKKQRVETVNTEKSDETKSADESAMEVESADKPVEVAAKEAEPMDVDKQDEPIKEDKTEVATEKVDKIEESATVKADTEKETDKSIESGTVETTPVDVKDVSDATVKETVQTENVKESSSEEVKKDEVPAPVAKEIVTEKTDVVVPEEKTEQQEKQTAEIESANAQPKEDKTEDNESKPDAVTEVKESSEKDEVVKEIPGKITDETETKLAEVTKEETEKVVTEEISEEKKEVTESETKEVVGETDVSKQTNETEDTKSAEDKTISEVEKSDIKTTEAEKKIDLEEKEKVNGTTNGTENGTTNGTENGTTNGTDNGTENGSKEADTAENGHKVEKEGITEVIVTKNPSQIENGSGDAAVVVEA
ncbi:Enolase-phosphatase E1 [Frankliniella fusca]|uniref:Enolase-phosphatase E1 n=1 Tax=Frankliniella fusca TaxID=407009 RepID=A0AAE1HKK7_9NEOP|nr:Enolase-phosphatase E1 [Frankliniella fusca]